MIGPHLTEDTLNEFLDGALADADRAGVEAHLAGCADCANRLSQLRALFARLEGLPEAPLQRDLRANVLTAVRASRPTVLRPIADPHRQAFRIVFAVQAFATLALLGFAWPWLASQVLSLPPLVIGDLGGLLPPALASWPDPNSLWLALQGWQTPSALLSPAVAGLVLVLASVCWLLGIAIVLRARPASRVRGNP